MSEGIEQIEKEDREEMVKWITESGFNFFLIKIERRIPDPEWSEEYVSGLHIVEEFEWKEIQQAMNEEMEVHHSAGSFKLQPNDFEIVTDDLEKVKVVAELIGSGGVSNIHVPFAIYTTKHILSELENPPRFDEKGKSIDWSKYTHDDIAKELPFLVDEAEPCTCPACNPSK